jgi:hypothetical protein
MFKTLLLSLTILVGCSSAKISENKKNEIAYLKQDDNKNLEQDQLQSIKETTMQDFLNSTIGTTSVLVLVYVAGGITFSPAWNWVKSKVPFLNK